MFEREECFIKNIVKKAYSKIIKNHNMEVSDKGEKDLVTNLDLATENFIINNIKKQFPNDYIVSEEFNSLAELKDRCWVIDPIDGTVNFTRKTNDWCIQMAFVCDGEVKTSVIYVPSRDELFFASSKGAFCNGKPIKVNSNVEIDRSIVAHGQVSKKYLKIKDEVVEVLRHMSDKIMKLRNYGSSGIEYSYVACGKCDGEMIFSNNMWDYLPGEFICKQAGGFVLSAKIKKMEVHAVFATKELCEEYEKAIKNSNN